MIAFAGANAEPHHTRALIGSASVQRGTTIVILKRDSSRQQKRPLDVAGQRSETTMKNFAKAAIVAFGVTGALAVAPASAQTYDPNYDDGYYEDEGAYPDDAYAQGYGAYDDQAYYDADYGAGYCDTYGCPEDYYDLPVFYGDVYYDNSWLTGPLYYRDWYGSRQFWVHGGWRSAQYRGGRFGPALGRNWYRQNRGFRNGFTNRNAYRGYSGGYRQRSFNGRNFSQPRNYGGRDFSYRQRSFSGNSNFAPDTRQSFRGNNDWRSNWSNRQGFGQNSFRQRDSGQDNFGQRSFRQRDFGQNSFRQREFNRPQSFSQQRQFGGGDRGSWRQNQNQQARSFGGGGGRNWGGRGDGGGRGDRGGDRGGGRNR